MSSEDYLVSQCLSGNGGGRRYERVVVHPLVLLNAVDHYGRALRSGSESRVVGVLLGQELCVGSGGKVLDITNSFAVPFSEDDDDVWFLNDEYLDSMYTMFWKINAREKIVGWYHSGPTLRPKDIQICEFFKKYHDDAVLVIIRAQVSVSGMPTQAYVLVEDVGITASSKTFEHLACEIEAEEAEEVGVEHLLRGIRNVTAGSLSQRIDKQIESAKGLSECLDQMRAFLDDSAKDAVPHNPNILEHLQNVINPLSNADQNRRSFGKPFLYALNDQMAVIYAATLCRAIVALHDLINNRLTNRNAEKAAAEKAAGGRLV